MLAPITIILTVSCSLQSFETEYLNAKPYEPYTLNKVITIQDMYSTDELMEKLFMQERVENDY